MARWGGAQGPVTTAKNAYNFPHYDVTHKKSKTFLFFSNLS